MFQGNIGLSEFVNLQTKKLNFAGTTALKPYLVP